MARLCALWSDSFQHDGVEFFCHIFEDFFLLAMAFQQCQGIAIQAIGVVVFVAQFRFKILGHIQLAVFYFVVAGGAFAQLLGDGETRQGIKIRGDRGGIFIVGGVCSRRDACCTVRSAACINGSDRWLRGRLFVLSRVVGYSGCAVVLHAHYGNKNSRRCKKDHDKRQ